jgi:Lrp/AsnC family transcriptional regulator, leucine-responsive regulatory protein
VSFGTSRLAPISIFSISARSRRSQGDRFGQYIVEVTLNKHDDKVLEEFGAALARIPEVVEAHLVTGDYDYLVKVAVAGTEHYEKILRESLYRIPGIQHSRSKFGLRALKETVSVDPLLLR